MTYGYTDRVLCTLANPCPSLNVTGSDGVYADGCDYITGDLYDWNSGAWKGKQRMLHARAYEAFSEQIRVANDGSYQEWLGVGYVVNDSNCQGGAGWSDYHVHHDYQSPSQSATCSSGKNTSIGGPTNREKQNPNHWVHRLIHQYDHSC
jgi:hypothetical protein